MDNLARPFLVGEFSHANPPVVGASLTLAQVTLCPDGASHSIYEELWHAEAYQRFIVERAKEAGDRYPSALPQNEHKWPDPFRRFLDGARDAAALAQAPERLAEEVEPGRDDG